jgi:hypothetical protein
MAEVDAKLVEIVTQQVLAALGERAGAILGAAGGLPMVCEFASKSNRVAANPSRKAGAAGAPVAKPAPAKIFMTADMLRQRMLKVGGSTLDLAYNEFLTPNAADLADRKHLTVNRVSKPTGSVAYASGSLRTTAPGATAPVRPAGVADLPPRIPNHGIRGGTAPGSLGLVVDRADDKVRAILAAMENQTMGLAAVSGSARPTGPGAWLGAALAPVRFDREDCAIGNLLALCGAVAAGKVRAGVALLPYAADAMVLANKVKGVRAVQGTRVASVSAGVRRFGANVLVLEHSFLTFHEMRSMIQALAAGQGQRAGNAIIAAMNQLEAR